MRRLLATLPRDRRLGWFYAALCVAVVLFLLSRYIALWSPEVGYAWLPRFGTHFHERKSDTFKQLDHLVSSTYGYDGQFYAQLAVDPFLEDAATAQAFDNPIFRARRILFSALPHALAGGRPAWALQIYCFQNIVFWLLTAVLMLRWLPPTDWQNTLRYLCVVTTAGLVVSVDLALVDGPALTLVLLGLLLVERKHETAGAAVLGLAGLGKETSIFAAAGLRLPDPRKLRSVVAWLGRLALVALPIFLWVEHLKRRLPNANADPGLGHFTWPLSGWWEAAARVHANIAKEGWAPYHYLTVIFLLAMLIQVVAILARPDWKNHWWRIGAVFACFAVFLNIAVWEGVVGSAARVMLPMTVAFNILTPRSKRWLPILILGNGLSFCGVHNALHLWNPRLEMGYGADFQSRLVWDGRALPKIEFGEGWASESASGAGRSVALNSGELRFDNPTGQDATAILRFDLRSSAAQIVALSVNGRPVERFQVGAGAVEAVEARAPLAPGENSIRLESDAAPSPETALFAIENCRFRVE